MAAGEDLAVSSALNLKEIDLEEPSATLVNSNPNLRIGIIPAGSTDTVVIRYNLCALLSVVQIFCKSVD